MNAETEQAAALAYESYCAYGKGKHPVTGVKLPRFAELDWRAQAAWGYAATALKVHYNRVHHAK